MSRFVSFAIGTCLLIGIMIRPSCADFNVAVSFNDPSATYSAYYGEITSNVQAAGADWSSHLAGTSGTLRIQVNFDNEPTASAGSATGFQVGTNGSTIVAEQGALGKVVSGYALAGSTYDAVLNIGTGFLTNGLYFDPNPSARTSTIPIGKTDAVSVFLHEICHMLFFNGYQNETNGTLPGNYESTFDRETIFDGTNFFFTGARAEALYGGPVPLTYDNIFHVGNLAPRPGSNLLGDLMDGVYFYENTRYDISALDLAMAADTGAPIIFPAAVPEPSSVLLVGIGLLGARGVRWGRRTLARSSR